MNRLCFILLIGLLAFLTACNGSDDSAGEDSGFGEQGGDIPANAIQISVEYAPESEQYMPEIMNRFNQAYRDGNNPITGQPLASGERPLYITGRPPQGGLSSGGVMQGIVNAALGADVDNVLRPTLFAPSVSHWLSLANIQQPGLFNIAEAQPTALSPVVIAIWESRLQAIQQKLGKEQIGWQDLLGVLKSPNGWEDYGIPGRKAVYYGHADPRNSSTALSTLISEYYACARQNGFTGRRLGIQQVRDDTVEECVRKIETLVRHYARRTEDFLEYVGQGPDYLDFLAVEEGDIICLNTGGRQGEEVCNKPTEKLVAIYPEDGTFIHEHPIVVVNADWVTAEQRQASEVFIDFMLLRPQQEYIMSFGFRPANPDVPVGFPFVEENGVTAEGPSLIIDIPESDVLIGLQEGWSLVRKQADVVILFDISGSMEADDKIGQARLATEQFLDNMEPTNRVGLHVFSDVISPLVPIANFETNESRLRQEVRTLQAGGGTELFAALRDTVNELNELGDQDRIRAVVLISDGEDTGTMGVTLNDALAAIDASQDSRNPIIVIPVMYGRSPSPEQQAQLNGIARASATRLVFGNTENIDEVLSILSSYF